MRKPLASAFLVTLLAGFIGAQAADLPEVTVYKSPSCGCCGKWVDQLKARGFQVKAINVQDVVPIKEQFRVPRQLGSCHTAIVEGYVIEGHVPIEDVVRLLEEKPDIRGIGVPGMPIGSPGMEGPNPQPFTVYAFDAAGDITEFAAHAP